MHRTAESPGRPTGWRRDRPSSSGSPRPTTRSSATSTSSPRSSGSCSVARWPWSSAPSSRAGSAAGRQPRPVQPALHDARHDHAAALRDTTLRGLRQCAHAAADRCPDVAFPRLNMFAYWLYLFGGLIAAAGFLTPAGASAFGWFAYAPLSDAACSPGLSAVTSGSSASRSVVRHHPRCGQLHHHDPHALRAPGMTMFRMPVFTWTVLITSILVLLVFPALAAALFALGADRRFGAHVFDPTTAGRCWQAHLLVLRSPRGLHHRVAVLRHHQRGPAGLQPQADLRLQDPGRATIAIAALSVAVWATTCTSPAGPAAVLPIA